MIKLEMKNRNSILSDVSSKVIKLTATLLFMKVSFAITCSNLNDRYWKYG